MGVVSAKLYIRPHLGAGIAQPHGVDVAGVHKGETGFLIKMNGGVQRIGEAVLEHPAQLGIGKLRSHFGNLGLYGLGHKQPVLGSRTLVRILLGAGAQGK